MCPGISTVSAQDSIPVFRQSSAPMDARVTDMLNRLTVSEKIGLLGYQSKAVPRLGIPAYNWWNEALHGVARAGSATVFPQAIGAAASFDDKLLQDCADAISTEARAKYNLAAGTGLHQQYMGLTFWSPNINLFRDPRWGRGQETYGEDPFLTGTMGSAFVKGIQGRTPGHLKASATAKHFAVHSGPEKERHGFNAVVSDTDLRETYLYAFKKLVDSGVEAVMVAYNRINGQPAATGKYLLRQILYGEWGFKGHVVTDCGALEDVYQGHKTITDPVEVAAAALEAGVDLDCSNLLQSDLQLALDRKLLSPKAIDSALAAILRTQFRLGFYDDPTSSPYAGYGKDSIENEYHRGLARKMAQESIVMLKNDSGLLPLSESKYHAIMVVGPNAASLDALLGNYHGVSRHTVNFVEGITNAVSPATRIEYDMGSDYKDSSRFGGIWAASNAAVTVAVLGLTAVYEGEEGDAFLAENGADRKDLSLPASQIAYMRKLRKGIKTPIVAVITAGSDIDVSSIAPYCDAILYAWYPGEEGGNAVADVLFGKVSPSGHLPVTFYNSVNDLPPYSSYAMKGRTYRYFPGKVQYPFGFGMSYSKFEMNWSKAPEVKHDSLFFSISVKNTGGVRADEVLQVYLRYPENENLPIKELKAFRRLSLENGAEATASFVIPASEINKWNEQLRCWTIVPGNYTLVAGENADDARLRSTFVMNGKVKTAKGAKEKK